MGRLQEGEASILQGNMAKAGDPQGLAYLIRPVCQEWVNSLRGTGGGEDLLQVTPQHSLPLQLKTGVLEPMYLRTRFSLSLEPLVSSYKYFCPGCSVTTHNR